MTITECLNMILHRDFSYAQAIGLLSNIEYESAFNENALGDKNSNGEFTSYGLCQWHGTRWERLKQYAGTITTVPAQTQIDFVKWEMEKYYPKTWIIFNSIENNKEGAGKFAYYFCYNYEVPANRKTVSEKRRKRAEELYEMYYDDTKDTETIINEILFHIGQIEGLIEKWKKQ